MDDTSTVASPLNTSEPELAEPTESWAQSLAPVLPWLAFWPSFAYFLVNVRW